MSNKMLPIYILSVRAHEQERIDRPNGYGSHQLALCTEGEGYFVDEKSACHTIQKGDLFCFAPNAPHKYYPAENAKWEVSFIVFSGKCVNDLLAYLEFDKPTIIFKNLARYQDELKYSFDMIFNAFWSNTSYTLTRSSGLLYNLLLKLWEYDSMEIEKRSKIETGILAPVIDFIALYYNRPISLEDMANVINVTPNQLCRLFKEYYDISPVKFLVRTRIERVKFLLTKYPNMNLSEIAAKTGFANKQYLVNTFKKYVGESTTDYKNKHPYIPPW